MIDIIGNKERR